MLDRRTALETARLFVAELKGMGYDPSQAWVFGSTINGKANTYSDIDLALWDKKFTGVSFIDAEHFVKLLMKYDPIEVHTYKEDATEREIAFIGEIKRTGERIL